jgi:hypothetical protein
VIQPNIDQAFAAKQMAGLFLIRANCKTAKTLLYLVIWKQLFDWPTYMGVQVLE